MRTWHPVAIVNAALWAGVILTVALMLRGQPNASAVVTLLGGASGISILLVTEELNKFRSEQSNGEMEGKLKHESTG